MALPEDLFRQAVGVDVGGIEEVDAGVEADIDQAGGLRDVGRSPGLEKLLEPPKVPVPKLMMGTCRPE